jgi:hypothetical protein
MSVTISAAVALAQNGYTTADLSAVNTEYMIDTCLNVVNQLAGQSIAALSGTAGTKSATCTRAQEPAVTTLITITLREAKKTSLSNSSSTSGSASTSKSTTMGPMSVSEGGSTSTAISAAAALNNAANSPLVDLFYRLIDSLKTGAVSTRHFMRA